jgi:hypothetical protein
VAGYGFIYAHVLFMYTFRGMITDSEWANIKHVLCNSMASNSSLRHDSDDSCTFERSLIMRLGEFEETIKALIDIPGGLSDKVEKLK